ncbi:MAG: hypothetical protein H8E12_25145 [Rhodobacteraceae bacterium]|nr:hypothetical protein [Paracoccaceae bacterium]
MLIKAGTPCLISECREDEEYAPISSVYGETFFSIDQEVEVTDFKCRNKNLIAVLTQANSIETLISHDEIKTIVWVNKHYFLKDYRIE